MTDQPPPPNSLSTPPSNPLLRRTLLGGLALGAGAAGVGVALWRGAGQAGKVDLPEPTKGFWQMQWDSPQGGVVRAQDFAGNPLLLNFWATWCPPCVEELPLINAYFEKNRTNGRQVLALAVDEIEAVQGFLRRAPGSGLRLPMGIAKLQGTALAKDLGNISAALPFSVLIGSSGEVLQRKLGKLNATDLEQWAALK